VRTLSFFFCASTRPSCDFGILTLSCFIPCTSPHLARIDPTRRFRRTSHISISYSAFQANSLDAFELGKRTTLFSDWRDESALDRSTLTPAIPRPTNLSRPFASLVGTDLIAAEKNVVEGVQGVRLPWTASPDQEDAKSLHLESRQMSGPSSLLSTDRSALDADLARAKASASRKGKGGAFFSLFALPVIAVVRTLDLTSNLYVP
jgi:hypothetical protein